MTQTMTEQRMPWGTTPEGELTRNGTILGSVMGTLAVFITLPLGVAGIIVSCMGLDRIRRHDPSAASYLRWSWILFVPGTVIGTALAVFGLVKLLA
jgi:hypothetical protein